MNLQNYPIGDKYPETINVVVEIPKGSRNKYEYREETESFELDRTLFSATFYPVDYGFIPQTRDHDGDALDAMIITDYPVFTGCTLAARVIGLMKMVDGGEVDDKILCVPAKNPHFDQVKSIDDIDPHTIKEIAHFFATYKLIQVPPKEVEIKGWFGTEEAYKIIADCYKMEQDRKA